MIARVIQFFREFFSPSRRRLRKYLNGIDCPEWFKSYLMSGGNSVDEYLYRMGCKKFLARVRYSTTREKWFTTISDKAPEIGERTKQSIGTFSTFILGGEIVEVRPYDFWQAQELGATDKYCRQCRKPLTPENDFGLVDVVGSAGRGYCSESCLRLSREA